MAAMHCQAASKAGWQLAACTDSGPLAAKIDFDADAYLTGIRRFCRMFKTGRPPLSRQRLLAPVAILEALEQAARASRLTPVARV